MERWNYSPRLVILVLIALVVGQILSINYLQKDFQNRIMECYQAINTNSIIQGAIINVLIEKNIMDKNKLLKEAENLSYNLNDIIKKMQAEKNTLKKNSKQSESIQDKKR